MWTTDRARGVRAEATRVGSPGTHRPLRLLVVAVCCAICSSSSTTTSGSSSSGGSSSSLRFHWACGGCDGGVAELAGPVPQRTIGSSLEGSSCSRQLVGAQVALGAECIHNLCIAGGMGGVA
jgi:hypothetical protein